MTITRRHWWGGILTLTAGMLVAGSILLTEGSTGVLRQ